uniref:Cystathionine gamma-lyase n=1 Tax=Petromyzon marinus TaxID=7757 RepID=S4R9H3_PETMA
RHATMAGEHLFLSPFPHFATDAVHAGQEPEQWNSMAVVPPISMATTFKQRGPGEHAGFEYSRSGNPTRNCLEKAVATLDGAKYAMAFSSGLAATVTITHLLKAGDGVICMEDVYGANTDSSRSSPPPHSVRVSRCMCNPINPLMVWVESPTNPLLKVLDIRACADVVHAKGDILLVVDNTFMSAYFQRPLSLGADLCMYSATKYMNGHSDVVMGLVSLNRDDVFEKLKFLQNAVGAVPSPFDCFLVSRGLKTLPVRMKQHFHSAKAVATFLEQDPRVTRVLYPGLPSHPQYEVSLKQTSGASGMVTFYIQGGLKESRTFLSSLKVFTLAESLGGYESLAEHPWALMTHASVPDDVRATLGISDTLIRLSVGLEETEDIIADIDMGLRLALLFLVDDVCCCACGCRRECC